MRISLQHSKTAMMTRKIRTIKIHLNIHRHPSKEVDLEGKVKYLPNLMSDIAEKRLTIMYIKYYRLKEILTVCAEVDLFVPGL